MTGYRVSPLPRVHLIGARIMKWFGIFALFLIAIVVVFKVNFPTYSYRYRLQIALSVDEKIYSGSSVIEVAWECGPKIPGLGQCAPSLRGQATVVDLGPRGVVVAALRSGENIVPAPDGAVDAIWLGANAFGNRSTLDELPSLPYLTGRRELTPSNFPRLVWFPNPADQNSATKITMQNVAKILDPTARFAEAFVEITKDRIVIDIAKKIPWFPKLEQEQRGKLILSNPGKFELKYNMFIGESS